MWWDKLIQPQGDPWLLRWDLARTNFLDRDLPPAFLYYNPWPEARHVTVETTAGKGKNQDLTRRLPLEVRGGKIELTLGPREARVVEIGS